MKNIELSERLSAVCSLVDRGCSVADIGTDHGFVPIYLIQNKIAVQAVAMDVNEGPLLRAAEHIEEYGLGDLIETRLSDGAKELKEGEADTVICAGMGGLLMLRILEDGDLLRKGIRNMILQPQSDLFSFRKRLRELKLRTQDESEIFEDGKFYTAMRVSVQNDTEADAYDRAAELLMGKSDCSAEDAERMCLRFGPVLIYQKDEVLKKYLEHEFKICESILLKLSEDEHTERVRDIINKKNDITTVLSLY